MTGFIKILLIASFVFVCFGLKRPAVDKEGYTLVWSDEFSKEGAPDTTLWRFENGFERNNEFQWYQKENAFCKDGYLIIEARKEHKTNPLYEPGSKDWRRSRAYIEYTSSSLNTHGIQSWQYGRFVMRAKIKTADGLWPAFWTLGISREWPSNGEIDIMEYYRDWLLANIACGTSERYKAKWFSVKKPVTSFKEKDWSDQFHTWKMDWDEKEIKLYVDDLLLNQVNVDQLTNPDGFNPFRQPHYLLLNLAIGGDNGGDPSFTVFPSRYIIDYVRVYQKK